MSTDRQPIMNNTDPAPSTNTTSTPVTMATSDGKSQDSVQKRHSCTYDDPLQIRFDRNTTC